MEWKWMFGLLIKKKRGSHGQMTEGGVVVVEDIVEGLGAAAAAAGGGGGGSEWGLISEIVNNG